MRPNVYKFPPTHSQVHVLTATQSHHKTQGYTWETNMEIHQRSLSPSHSLVQLKLGTEDQQLSESPFPQPHLAEVVDFSTVLLDSSQLARSQGLT